MKILLTGFEPFGEFTINPSQMIVETVAKHPQLSTKNNLITAILPTEFRASELKIKQLIKQNQPDAIICLGVAANTKAIHLERIALNLDDSSIPDNANLLIDAQPIIPDAPLAYLSTLPLNSIRQLLQNHQIPVKISNHAGTYVCNHVFYVARHFCEQLPHQPICGFIHVPPMSEQIPSQNFSMSHLPLETMVRAIQYCISLIN